MEFAARYQDGLVADVRDVLCVIDLAAEPVALVDPRSREPRDHRPLAGRRRLSAPHPRARAAHRQPPASRRARVSPSPASTTCAAPSASCRRSHKHQRARRLAAGPHHRPRHRRAGLGDRRLSLRHPAARRPARRHSCRRLGSQDRRHRRARRSKLAHRRQGLSWSAIPIRNSLANRAIARFVDDAFDGLGSPFKPDVTVVRSDVPNAFALPGGRAYYLSALLAGDAQRPTSSPASSRTSSAMSTTATACRR